MVKKKDFDLSALKIERIIIHDIPWHRKKQEGVTPYYSERDTDIPDGIRVFFKDKVINALQSSKAFNICFDETKDSPVPVYIQDLMSSNGDIFIAHSKKIADCLLGAQGGANTEGILLVMSGSIEENLVCVLMKLEKDNGLQLERNMRTNSFDIKEIHNLMLTNKTKLYKIALFVPKDNFKITYDGVLIDFQIDIKAKKEIQTFFMNDFLGCKPNEEPKVATQKFYNYTKKYIEEMIDDKPTQARYVQDLNSYIQKNQNTICPREFADDYFETSEHKDNYKKYVQTKKISYSKAIMKDTILVADKIKKITIAFVNGILLTGDKGTLKNKVEFSKSEDGLHDKAVIISKIKKVT